MRRGARAEQVRLAQRLRGQQARTRERAGTGGDRLGGHVAAHHLPRRRSGETAQAVGLLAGMDPSVTRVEIMLVVRARCGRNQHPGRDQRCRSPHHTPAPFRYAPSVRPPPHVPAVARFFVIATNNQS
ncbi:hypothetical protein NS334_04625 [Sphingomonas endophytica]|uniref:Uncharacterized protein n=1 Tax=Sphingomonas endophytica TaxID=869719 RepID=A0A147I6X3_9SPHN|nr:hypothetical protein NS334_04625 [Sphingomonas endophytica]